MFSTMNWLTRSVHFFACSVLFLLLFTLAATTTPSAQANPLAAQDSVAHVVRLDGPAVVRIVSVIQAKLICRGCLTTGGDVSSPTSGTITYASSGSGALITPDGYVLTADHVVDHGAGNPEDVDLIEQSAATDIAKQLNNGTDTPDSVYKFLQNHPNQVDISTTIPFQKVFLSTGYTGDLQSVGDIISYDVTSVAAHSPVIKQDTAIIKVDAHDVPYIAVAPPNSVSVGDTVTAIAFPADADLALNNADFTALVDPTQSDLNTLNSLLGSSVNTGQVTAKKVRSDGTGVYESNGISSQGSSGGPIIDNQGQIIGFVDAGPSTDRLTFLIPSEVIATYVNEAGAARPRAGTFMALWTVAANEYDSSASCHWSNAYKDLITLHRQYPKFGAIRQYLSKAQQQAAGEICATTGSGASAAGRIFLVGCLLTLVVVIGAIVLVVVLLSRRKRVTSMPVGVPMGAGYPMQQQAYPPVPQQMPMYPGYLSYGAPPVPAAPQSQLPTPPLPIQFAQPVQQTPPPAQPNEPQMPPPTPPIPTTAAAAPGSATTATMPMRRCLNGHIVADPAAIFCGECGAGIHLPHS